MWRTVVFAALLGSALGQNTPVDVCENGEPLPIHINVEGCTSQPCILPQMQDAVITIIFKAPRLIRSMETRATARVAFLPIAITYPLGEAAVTCNFLENTYCPIIPDEVVVYTLNFYIDPLFPEGTVATIDFSIVDENSVTLVCSRIVIQITAPVSGTSNNSKLLLSSN